jgi:transposase InsO family protein
MAAAKGERPAPTGAGSDGRHHETEAGPGRRCELFEYVVYYNNYRPHQAIGGQTPKDFALAKNQPNRSAN